MVLKLHIASLLIDKFTLWVNLLCAHIKSYRHILGIVIQINWYTSEKLQKVAYQMYHTSSIKRAPCNSDPLDISPIIVAPYKFAHTSLVIIKKRRLILEEVRYMEFLCGIPIVSVP